MLCHDVCCWHEKLYHCWSQRISQLSYALSVSFLDFSLSHSCKICHTHIGLCTSSLLPFPQLSCLHLYQHVVERAVRLKDQSNIKAVIFPLKVLTDSFNIRTTECFGSSADIETFPIFYAVNREPRSVDSQRHIVGGWVQCQQYVCNSVVQYIFESNGYPQILVRKIVCKKTAKSADEREKPNYSGMRENMRKPC